MKLSIRFINLKFLKSIVLLFIFQFINISSVVWSADYPTQSERFKGMGATFKEAKKNEHKLRAEIEEIKTEETDTAGNYFKLHTFVVNVRDKSSHKKINFLTLDIFCETKNINDKVIIEYHIAPVKDVIITYISGIERTEIQTPGQKKALQDTLTQKVSDILYRLTGKKLIIQLYITRILVN